jgi:PAP2 superfamily
MSRSATCKAQSQHRSLAQDIRLQYGILVGTLMLLVWMAYRTWGSWYTCFGITAGPFLVLVAWFCWRRRLSAWTLIPALLQAVLGFFIVWGNQIWSTIFSDPVSPNTHTFDTTLLSVDGSFGFEPSVWLRHLVGQLHLYTFCKYTYIFLPLAMSFAYIAHLRCRKRLLYIPVVLGTVSIGGLLLYQVVPACGPIYLLGESRFVSGHSDIFSHLAAMTTNPIIRTYLYNSISIPLTVPRNAMPSLHVSWALLIFWICRDLRLGRWVAGAFLFCTAISTMAVGEHYLVDVVAAFPFALLVWQVCVGEGSFGSPRRVLSSLAGALMLLLWLTSLRFAPQVFWYSPVLPWSAAVVTVGYSLWAVSPHPDQQLASQPVDGLKTVSELPLPETCMD